MLSSAHKIVYTIYSINGIEEGKGLIMIFNLWSPWPCSKEDDQGRNYL